MANGGFKVFDSDMHIMEPPDLWERYIDAEFRERAPRGRTSENVRDLGMIFPNVPAQTRRTNGTPHRGRNYNKNQDIYRDHAARGWTGEVQLEAMNTEGIDMAVLFPTRGLGILTYPDQEPRFAAAMARAYNDWLHDFCQANPTRLLGAGMISVYDIKDAIAETRRVAEHYGFRSVFLRSNIVNGKNWYDPYYEPLWETLEELNLPLGFHEASASRSRQCAENFEPNFGMRRVYAQPFEQMLGLGSFLGGGILERHPKMKVAFLEANCSWLPWLLWRLDEGYEREGDIFMQDIKCRPANISSANVLSPSSPMKRLPGTPSRNLAAISWSSRRTIRTAIPSIPMRWKVFSSFRWRTMTSEKYFGTIARVFMAPVIRSIATLLEPNPLTVNRSSHRRNNGDTSGNPDRYS
jgi:uncharacterized protein